MFGSFDQPETKQNRHKEQNRTQKGNLCVLTPMLILGRPMYPPCGGPSSVVLTGLYTRPVCPKGPVDLIVHNPDSDEDVLDPRPETR